MNLCSSLYRIAAGLIAVATVLAVIKMTGRG